MPKTNGSVSWKAAIVFVTIGGMIIGACWGYLVLTANKCHANAIKAAQIETKAEGSREELRDFRREQRQWNEKTEGKLDRILERLR